MQPAWHTKIPERHNTIKFYLKTNIERNTLYTNDTKVFVYTIL